MKKITLACLAVTCFAGSAFSQLNYTQVSPPDNGSTSAFRGPNGTSGHALQRSLMFIHPYELLPMNSASITSVGFQYKNGTGSIPVVGNFTLYMQNASSTTWAYAKGSTWTGAATGLQQVYTGTYTVPAATGTAVTTISLTTPFGFTGDGLYVGWEFSSAGPFATAPATLQCANNFAGYAEAWMGTMDATVTPLPNTFTGSNFRPALIINATNNNTNEVEVIDIIASGKVAKQFNTTQTITTNVVNSSIGSQSNVVFTLNAVGANPYTATQTITMLPGAITTLSWSAYNPTVNGQSTITISGNVPSDVNTANNTKTWIQEVTCNTISHNKPASTFTFNSSFGYGGATGSGCFMSRHVIPTAASLTAVEAAIGTNTANANQPLYGVLVSATGSILAASTNTVNLTPGTTATLNFANIPLTAGSVYYIGVAQPTSGYYPLAYQSATFEFDPSPYYTVPLIGGTAVSQAGINGYLGIDAIFSYSSAAITAQASKTVVCKNAGTTITLTANATGVSSFSWSSGGTGTQVAVTPTLGGSGVGPVFYYVVGTETVTGCKTGSASITVSISACTALENNNTNGYDLKVFPNPAVSGKTTISGLNGTNSIIVYNNLGQVVLTRSVSEESTAIDLSAQPAGNYLIRITSSENETRTVKIVNQN